LLPELVARDLAGAPRLVRAAAIGRAPAGRRQRQVGGPRAGRAQLRSRRRLPVRGPREERLRLHGGSVPREPRRVPAVPEPRRDRQYQALAHVPSAPLPVNVPVNVPDGCEESPGTGTGTGTFTGGRALLRLLAPGARGRLGRDGADRGPR